jgi:endo-1,4-beta-xylanase
VKSLKANKRSLKQFSFIRAGLVLLILMIVVGLSYYFSIMHNEIDLLSNQDWSHFPGASQTSSGLRVVPLNSEITHHDTSLAQPNPPINIRGPHLQLTGDFRIDAQITGVNNGATIEFYGKVPIIYDEWRQERGSVRVDVSNTRLIMQVWDGSSSTSNDIRTYKVSLRNTATITFIHKGDQIIIAANGNTLGSMPDHNIFASQTVWFGADATPGSSGWTLNSLRTKSLDDGHLEVVEAPGLTASHNQPDALRNLAATQSRDLPIGAAISIYPLFNDPHYRAIALGQFSMMTPENSMKPEFIHPAKNTYSFTDADSLVDTALKNNMIVHGHFLISDKSNPNWILDTPINERQQIMTDHITTVVSHFRGRVAEWDVVNEPLSENDIDYTNGNLGIRQDLWSDAMGENYIDIAFRAAHAADPAAKLYLNDFGLEKAGERWDALVALIQRLQANGVPINGVGFEAHVYSVADIIDPVVLKAHIEYLASLGIVSRISEIDVMGDDPVLQAQQYSDVLLACLQEPTCTSYGVWGISDLYGSQTLSDRYPAVLGHSLLWNDNMIPKPAVSSLQNILINTK